MILISAILLIVVVAFYIVSDEKTPTVTPFDGSENWQFPEAHPEWCGCTGCARKNEPNPDYRSCD